MGKRDDSWNPSTSIHENGKQLKNIADITVILSDEIINVMDGVSINMTNSIPAN